MEQKEEKKGRSNGQLNDFSYIYLAFGSVSNEGKSFLGTERIMGERSATSAEFASTNVNMVYLY